jgi:hypothetical protein
MTKIIKKGAHVFNFPEICCLQLCIYVKTANVPIFPKDTVNTVITIMTLFQCLICPVLNNFVGIVFAE